MLSCMGPCAKYSCCLYPTGKETLAEAEVLMLESYCEKAQLKDGLEILDLGCGMLFGSLHEFSWSDGLAKVGEVSHYTWPRNILGLELSVFQILPHKKRT